MATPDEPFCNPKTAFQNANLTSPGEAQATWVSGTVVDVAWAVSVNHAGAYQYRLCFDGSDSEECFKKTPLLFEDGQAWHFVDTECSTCSGTVPDHGSTAPLMRDRVVVPPHIFCERCTLGWRWDALHESTIFTGCADVQITASSIVA